MVSIDNARQAGVLAAKIDAQSSVQTVIQKAIDGGWTICDLVLNLSCKTENMTVQIGSLDAQASMQALTLAKKIYQAQIDALNKQLQQL